MKAEDREKRIILRWSGEWDPEFRQWISLRQWRERGSLTARSKSACRHGAGKLRKFSLMIPNFSEKQRARVFAGN